MKVVKRLRDFIKYNDEKGMTVKAYIYAAYFRMCILILNKKNTIMYIENEKGKGVFFIFFSK